MVDDEMVNDEMVDGRDHEMVNDGRWDDEMVDDEITN